MTRTYCHRDTMLSRLGRMPARRPNETDAAFEHRKAARATEVAKEYGLTKYSSGSRAIQYDEAEVKRAHDEHVKPIAA